ncbi:hypothetical protein HHI36_013560, partial [Cryptolaemus montrouzieri]
MARPVLVNKFKEEYPSNYEDTTFPSKKYVIVGDTILNLLGPVRLEHIFEDYIMARPVLVNKFKEEYPSNYEDTTFPSKKYVNI